MRMINAATRPIGYKHELQHAKVPKCTADRWRPRTNAEPYEARVWNAVLTAMQLQALACICRHSEAASGCNAVAASTMCCRMQHELWSQHLRSHKRTLNHLRACGILGMKHLRVYCTCPPDSDMTHVTWAILSLSSPPIVAPDCIGAENPNPALPIQDEGQRFGIEVCRSVHLHAALECGPAQLLRIPVVCDTVLILTSAQCM